MLRIGFKFGLMLLVLCLVVFAKKVKPYNGEKVTLEVHLFQPHDETVKAMLPEFNKKYPHIKVNTKVQAFGDHHVTLQTAFAAKNNVPDVAYVEIQFVGSLGSGGGFDNLMAKPYNAKQYEKVMAVAAWRRAQSKKGVLFAIPVDVAPGCAYYNVELLERIGMKIEDLKTMNDLFNAGKKVTKDWDGDGKVDTYLIADPFNFMRIFLASDDYYFFDKRGKPRLNRQRMKDGMTWYKKICDAGLSPRICEWCPEWYATFQNGTTLFQFSGAWLAGYLKSWMAPKQIGKYRVAELPAPAFGQPRMKALRGGSFIGIPKDANRKNKGAAWEFIKFCCLNDKVQLNNYRLIDAFPAKTTVWNDPMFDEPIEYLGGQKARNLWRKIMKEAPDQYVNEHDRTAFTLLADALEDVRTGKATVDEAVNKMQEQIEKIVSR